MSWVNYSTILKKERDYLKQRRAQMSRDKVATPASEKTLDSSTTAEGDTALCLSGGGIRSASFCLGVMRALAADRKLLDFDYFSTVSGGGFAGAFMALWIKRLHSKNMSADEVQQTIAEKATFTDISGPLGHLRRHTNYLTPKTGIFALDTLAGSLIFLRNMIINLLLIAPYLIMIILSVQLIEGIPHLVKGNSSIALILLVLGLLIIAWSYAEILRNNPARPRSGRNLTDEASMMLLLRYGGFYFLSALFLALAFAINNQPLEEAVGRYYLFSIFVGVFLILVAVLYSEPFHHYLKAAVSGDSERQNSDTGDTGKSNWLYALWGIGAFLTEGAVVAALLMTAVILLMPHHAKADQSRLVIIFAPLILSILLSSGQIVYLIVTSKHKGLELQREWLARFAAKQLQLPVLWAIVASSVLFAPVIVCGILKAISNESTWWQKTLASAAAALPVISGLLAIILGRSGHDTEDGALSWEKYIRKILFSLIIPVFAVGLVVGTSALVKLGLTWLIETEWVTDFARRIVTDPGPMHCFMVANAVVLACLILLSLFLALLIDVNRFSLHDVYRNRLVRAFLGGHNEKPIPDPFTKFDEEDDIPLAGLVPAKGSTGRRAIAPPLLLSGMALNVNASSELAWQERKALPFTASALAIGSQLLNPKLRSQRGGFRQLNDPNGNDAPFTLGGAMAISGAAFNTAMGHATSFVLSVLFTIFNMRLGVWVGNPLIEKTWKKDHPPFPVQPLFSEMLGLTRENSSYIHLSDGGHFDNLGLYEMLTRRCSQIWVIDAGCDPGRELTDLAKALRMAELDDGVVVKFPDGELQQLMNGELSHTIASITYPDRGQNGKLVYLKPTCSDNIPVQVSSYAAQNPQFPHESTADQWFGESQFMAYFYLGEYLVAQVEKSKCKITHPTIA